MHYVSVFDASASPYRNLSFLVPDLPLLVVGIVMVVRPEWLEVVFRKPLERRWLFRWSFFLFVAAWTIGATASTLGDSYEASRSVRDGRCRIVEGRVNHFHPMPFTGHDEESFDVNGVKFAYSDYVVSAGYNKTASHGGPIRQGLPVRICHQDGEILRLEIAR